MLILINIKIIMRLLPGFMYFAVKGMIKNTIFIIFMQKLCNGGHLQKKF